MPGRPTGLLLLVLPVAACTVGGPAASSPPRTSPAASATAVSAPVRLRYGPEAAFWLGGPGAPERLVAAGARLELGPSGEITAVAWDRDLALRGDLLVGALAVPERLGGGFVHWTRTRLFRSREFTGPLESLPGGVDGAGVRGARVGLASILVFTDAGPRELVPGAARVRPLAEPGLADAAAISATRAARLDVFGRVSATDDGGRRWMDLSPAVGLDVQRLGVSDDDLFVSTGNARLRIRPGGLLDDDDGGRAGSDSSSKRFQILRRPARERDEGQFGSRDPGPLASAVGAGAPVGDGTAFAMSQGAAVRVDLATGKLLAVSPDWVPTGLSCQPVRAKDAVLWACVWERYQGYGGCVLRSDAGAPPVVEKVFTDDGAYVVDDDGAVAFMGSCRAEPHLADLEDPARADTADPTIRPVLCARRGPGDWIEHQIDAADAPALVAWAVGEGGEGVALLEPREPLPPPPSPAGRVSEQAGVRVVRLVREPHGWAVVRGGWPGERTGVSGYVDRRFHVRDDGSIDAWLAPREDQSTPVAIGATIDPGGFVTVHEAAPGMVGLVAGGAFGVAVSGEGVLYETTDHGRTFRAAGKSPVPPAVLGSAACSALGCALGPVVRLGWGEGGAVADVTSVGNETRLDPEPRPRLPRLSCAPVGPPSPSPAAPALPAVGELQAASTGWGDNVWVVRDANVPEPPPSGSGTPPPPSAPAPGPARKPVKASPAVLHTHTLSIRTPFDPRGGARRLDATDAAFTLERRHATVTPLLAPSGEVDLLVAGDERELLVTGDRVTGLPVVEGRRRGRGNPGGAAGLSTAAGRALVLGDFRRRLTLEDRGPGAPRLPAFLGVEPFPPRFRPMSLARRDDGTVGALVIDGPAPETVGAATIDAAGASAGPVVRLASWATVTTADDPACRKEADPEAFRALVRIDAAAWLSLDAARLPGVALGSEGMVRVRWGRERVCVEGLEAAVTDLKRRGEGRTWSLVARWGGEKERGAALIARDVRQALVCRIER